MPRSATSSVSGWAEASGSGALGAGPEAAIAAYVEVARKYGLAPAQLALAYVNAQPFVTSNLIGATSLEQLATNIASVDIRLPREAIDEIEAIHARAPNLCP